ncbi:DUF4870 domain-containing protein [Cellulomonas sp. Leaf334]|uniref:DUF4870 domain-containing protein n=1 Tax=Cellulomonas sp. Leaf334 TaxID=1736339 RepID=UPI0006F39CD0|nr:DUF4870 domain-containing protein [Cellulomonas sp. Leaf334]KQR16542.1 hypothetical protein ASF78_03985 [Cellulomonas sp. Leaf334]
MSYEHPQNPPSSTDQVRTLGMLAHLGGILAYFYAGWVAALVIWLVNREKANVAATEARVALNFQLTVLIALIVCAIVRSIPVIGFVGWLGFIAVSIISLVLSVLAAVAVQRGGSYRYPFSLELVR